MEPVWNYQVQGFVWKEAIDNQTLLMSFCIEKATSDTIYYNVCASIYSKRKQASRNEDTARITGKNPFASFIKGRKAFKKIEKACIEKETENRNLVIYIRWVDNRRRDAYYKVLSKMGYRYGRDLDNQKCLLKKVPCLIK